MKIATNSKLANRDDVRSALAAALEAQGVGQGAEEVKQMDQVLFKGVFPSNMWVVALGSREAAQRLLRQGQVQSPSGNLRVEEVGACVGGWIWVCGLCGVGCCENMHVMMLKATGPCVCVIQNDCQIQPTNHRPTDPT